MSEEVRLQMYELQGEAFNICLRKVTRFIMTTVLCASTRFMSQCHRIR